jgi:hypothetical protein
MPIYLGYGKPHVFHVGNDVKEEILLKPMACLFILEK